jgi:4-hydroxy-tetrahydrodipicolinate reductase
MTNILLIGYGSMGRVLHRLAPSMSCEIVGIVDVDTPFDAATAPDFDVAIDFTQPDAVIENVRTISGHGKNVVIGTTGWNERRAEVETIQHQTGTGIIVGSNFSVGVQMFFRLVREAGLMVNDLADLDVMLHEWHHHRKKDSPSGTALTAASLLLDVIDRKTYVEAETQHGTIDPSALHVSSTRGGEVVGRHQLTIDGATDTIDIIHNAKSRDGFAQGALLAATWIHGKQGMYDFTDVFPDILRSARS